MFFEKRFWMVATCLSIFSTLIACSNGSGDGAVTPEKQREEALKANPITANQWCRVSDNTTSQLVTRMTFTEHQVTLDYLRVTPDKAPVVYKSTTVFDWTIKQPTELSVPTKYIVSYRPTEADVKALYGYDKQKEIFTKVINTHPQLSRAQTDFAPKNAVSAWIRNPYLGGETEKNLYPCSDYSPSFLAQTPERPILELNLILAQESDTYYKYEGDGRFAKSVALQTPINEVKPDLAAMNNTQWCAWHEVSANSLKLHVLSISGGKFLENEYTEEFATFPDEGSQLAKLQENSTHGEFFDMSLQNGWLKGVNKTTEDRDYPAQDLFTIAQDANDVQALVRLDINRPDDTNFLFTDIYLKCNDPRAPQFSPAFGARLQSILDLEMKRLQP